MKPEAEQNEHQQETAKSQPEALAGEQVRSPERSNSRQEEKGPPQSRPRRWENLGFWLQILFNGLVMLFTGGLFWLSLGQLEEMRSNSADTRAIADAAKAQSVNTEKLAVAAQQQIEVARGQAEAARQQAETAQRALDSSRESSQLNQRAWIGVVQHIAPPRFEEFKSYPFLLSFGVVITNTGGTPALNIRSRVEGRVFPRKEKFSPAYTQPLEKNPGVFSGVLFPDARAHLATKPMRLTYEQGNALRFNRSVMYVFGEVLYEDVFRKSHRTTFCLYLTLGADPPTLGSSEVFACETYNEAD